MSGPRFSSASRSLAGRKSSSASRSLAGPEISVGRPISRGPEIFVGVPIFRGAETLTETLRSIREQTFGDYRVVLSIDAGDEESAAVCTPYLADPRFELVVQPERLDWAGNFSWLVARCDYPFFVYRQQDDLTATNYLAALRAKLPAHPAAAVAYADVQWFGARFERDRLPATVGSPRRRVLQAIEQIRYESLRGLIRTRYLPAGPAIEPHFDDGCHGEFAFLAKLAARGELRRVPHTLYFKRGNPESVGSRRQRWPERRKRRTWIDLGLAFRRIATAALPGAATPPRLVPLILDRLTIGRLERGFFGRPLEKNLASFDRFVRDFLGRGGLSAEVDAPVPATDAVVLPLQRLPATVLRVLAGKERAHSWLRPPHRRVIAAQAVARREEATRRTLGSNRLREGRLGLDLLPGGCGIALLGYGWAEPTAAGVPNAIEDVTLFLPPAGPGPWRLTLIGVRQRVDDNLPRLDRTAGKDADPNEANRGDAEGAEKRGERRGGFKYVNRSPEQPRRFSSRLSSSPSRPDLPTPPYFSFLFSLLRDLRVSAVGSVRRRGQGGGLAVEFRVMEPTRAGSLISTPCLSLFGNTTSGTATLTWALAEQHGSLPLADGQAFRIALMVPSLAAEAGRHPLLKLTLPAPADNSPATHPSGCLLTRIEFARG